jgi:type VI secretion system protein ImpF
MSELVRGASVPLFDRLSARYEATGDMRQLLSPEDLQASIGRELSRLMNTRSRLTPTEFLLGTGTAIDYGLPDFQALSARSQAHSDLLQSMVTLAVGQYEPRLKDVSVKVFPSPGPGSNATLVIGGTVKIGMKLRQLNFELQLDQRTGDTAAEAA